MRDNFSWLLFSSIFFTIIHKGDTHEGEEDQPVGLITAHAVFMSFAWAICASSGIFVSRFLKKRFPLNWFRIHIILTFGTCVFTSLGFLMILIFLKFSLLTNNPHHILGYLIIGGLIIQPLLGFLADKYFQPSRLQAPIFPDRIHWYLGGILWLSSLINIYLGIQMQSDYWGSLPVILFYISIAVFATILLFTKKPEDRHTNKKDTLLTSQNNLELE